MKLITAIVRPERLPDVKAALFRAGVTGITLSRVSGHGGEHEILSQYRGSTVVMEFHEKIRIEMACSEPFAHVGGDVSGVSGSGIAIGQGVILSH